MKSAAQQIQSNAINKTAATSTTDDPVPLTHKVATVEQPSNVVQHISPSQRNRPASAEETQHNKSGRPQPPFNSKHIPNSISIPHARALFDYVAKENG